VVVAFVLCSVSSVEQTLREVGRVLRPGGTFVFVEHIPVCGWRGWRQRVADLPRCVRRRGGCHQRRDPRAAIAAAFASVELAEQPVVRRDGAPSLVVVGHARRPAGV
jgi:SAM-dependent methyltransferase